MAIATSASAGVNFKQTHHPTRNRLSSSEVKFEQMVKKDKFSEMKRVNQKPGFRAPITQQPEGELKSYNRSGQYVYPYYGYQLYCVNQTGRVDIVYGADNKVYLKNILSGVSSSYGDSWVEGTIHGSTIRVPLGQSIYYSEDYDADVVITFGQVQANEDGNYSFEVDNNVNYAIYGIEDDGKTLTLMGTEANPEDVYCGYGLGAYWTDNGSWNGVCEWNTVLTYTDGDEFVPTLITEQPEGTLYSYFRSGDVLFSNYFGISKKTQSGKLNVVFGSGGKVYIQNPLFSYDYNTWVEGTYDWMTGLITIPTGQYISWDDTNKFGLQVMWGSSYVYQDGVDGNGDPIYMLGTEVNENTTAIKFMIDDDHIYLLNSAGDLNAEYPEWVNTTGIYGRWSDDESWAGEIDFNTVGQLVTQDPKVPANPTADDWYDCGYEGGYSKFYFTLPSVDVDGNLLDPECLSYSLFIDNGNGAELFTFPAEDYRYDLTEDITEVPYWLYTSAVDFKTNFCYIYRTNAEGYEPFFTKNIGIQVYYTCGGVKNASEIAWLYEESQGLRGDVNGDESVTIGDVIMLIDYLLGYAPEGFNKDNADCNLNNEISIADVTALIDYLLAGQWPSNE